MYTPLHAHSWSSLSDAISNPEHMAKYCVEHGMKSCGLTDHGNIYAHVEFHSACTKQGIKPLLGVELYISKDHSSIKTNENRQLTHLPVLAKTRDGWNNLIKIMSYANQNLYYKPRISLDELKQFSTDLWAFSGHPGSTLLQGLFQGDVYRAKSGEIIKYLTPNWKDTLKANLDKHLDIFGENFFIEIQLIDKANIPATAFIADILRDLSSEYGIKKVGTADSHYIRKVDAPLQRVLLCSTLRTTITQVQSKLDNNQEVGFGAFFTSDNYGIPTPEEMTALYTQDELDNTNYIADHTELYELSSSPRLPSFPCPIQESEYLKQLCFKSPKLPQNNDYIDRLNHELEVIIKNNLVGYFLIVQDYVNWAKDQGVVVGIGRGSSAGCLVSYLLNITEVDPLKYGLIFERFYNEGRNKPGKVSLPDIDCDFPREFRDSLIEYLRNKYGTECVGHIVTLSTLQGRGALKEVLRVYNACSVEEMHEITKNIPQEAEISDHLEIMKQERGYSSIIEWALENEPEDLRQWCYKTDEGLKGSFSEYFDIAIKLEGVKKNESKHASGVIISNTPLSEIVPMVNKGEMLVGMEMTDLEQMGLVKFDILGLKSLSAIQDILKVINA